MCCLVGDGGWRELRLGDEEGVPASLGGGGQGRDVAGEGLVGGRDRPRLAPGWEARSFEVGDRVAGVGSHGGADLVDDLRLGGEEDVVDWVWGHEVTRVVIPVFLHGEGFYDHVEVGVGGSVRCHFFTPCLRLSPELFPTCKHNHVVTLCNKKMHERSPRVTLMLRGLPRDKTPERGRTRRR